MIRTTEENPGENLTRIRAAQYVRMSTEHQKYSTENQADTIARYAATRGYEIVRTYEDAGKSGLSLDGREALKRLIEDVLNNRTDFAVVLVYDVSRWGRFQDADESAHYEFICRQRGITVHYCAEQFDNDGSIGSTVMKSIKRAMAGEYSRELSKKVFAGQCRLIEKGFRQGGPAGYGLRRQLIDEERNPKSILKRGEHKSLQTDRVILIPGPPEEVETVRQIYRLFTLQRRNEAEIATLLNKEGISGDLGRSWTRGAVHQILTNEKYVGDNVYNRSSCKLKAKRVTNAPDQWVRCENAFEPLVDRDFFNAARFIIEERSRRLTDQDLLDKLSALLRDKGWLSGLVIDELDDMPSSSIYRHRFGSLIRAYSLIGYSPGRDYRYIETNKKLREMHPSVVANIVARLQEVGATVDCNPATDILTINGEFDVSVVIARYQLTEAGSARWKIRLDSGLRPDITIAVRMDSVNEQAQDYYLLPWLDVGAEPQLKLAPDNGIMLDAYRYENLDSFYDLAKRTFVRDAR